MARLRVRAGPSTKESDLKPVSVNTNEAFHIRSDVFDGQIIVHIKGLLGDDGKLTENEYFKQREGVTWSIQMQGRFLKEYSADDILFGNTFEEPLQLPPLSGVVLGHVTKFLDPVLMHDLTAPKPWALSPFVATMPHLMHHPTKMQRPKPLSEGVLILDEDSPSDLTGLNGGGLSAGKRRAHFKKPANRSKVKLGPKDIITADFCYNFLTFPDLKLEMPVLGWKLSLDVMKYWNGQPVRFVCCLRPDTLKNGHTSGAIDDPQVFFCVSIDKV